MRVLKALEKYINQTLGLEVDAAAWEDGGGNLPFFLRNAYDFFLLRLLGRDYLLIVDRQREEVPPATIRKHMEQLRKVWPEELIYVREQMTGYNRNRLIRNQMPFIVPGNQLYLPMLAIDLREHFIARREEVKKVSPAAQMLVLYAIYNHRILFDQNTTLTAWGKELNYTKMTMTRAFRELRTVLEGEEHFEKLAGRRLWDRLRPYLRSPIRRRRYYHVNLDLPEEKGAFLAGDSALAHYAPMTEPNHTVICMVGQHWNRFVATRNPFELANPEPGCVEVEIWRYPPRKFAINGFADPLSVYLSFEKNADERIEMALETLFEDVPW